jgi:hypothetical protein
MHWIMKVMILSQCAAMHNERIERKDYEVSIITEPLISHHAFCRQSIYQ